jgi:hypothetical protein
MIRIFGLFIVAAFAAASAGCSNNSSCKESCGGGGSGEGGSGGSGGAGPSVTCKASFAGNYTQTDMAAGQCAAVKKDKKGSWTLTITVTSTKSGVETISIFDLGASPSPGKFGPESIQDWSVIGVGAMPCFKAFGPTCAMACEYSAGNAAVPAGEFSLNLAEVDLSGATPTVHGTLEATQTVQPGLGVDCGDVSEEELAVVF